MSINCIQDKIMEIKDLTKEGTYYFGICSCCGKTITCKIFNKKIFHWFCTGPQLKLPCLERGNPHERENCPITKESNELYLKFIKNTVYALINRYHEAFFIEDLEIFHALKDDLDKFTFCSRGNILDNKKLIQIFKKCI